MEIGVGPARYRDLNSDLPVCITQDFLLIQTVTGLATAIFSIENSPLALGSEQLSFSFALPPLRVPFRSIVSWYLIAFRLHIHNSFYYYFKFLYFYFLYSKLDASHPISISSV